MTKQKTAVPRYVTREILKKELSASGKRLDVKIDKLDVKIDNVEKRLDTKIDASTQSMKDYADSRFTQLNTKIDGVAQKMETRFDKFERYFEQLVGMFVQQNKKIDGSLDRLEDHEHRIGVLEEKPG